MIEIQTKYQWGQSYISSIKIVEPRIIKNGIEVELVSSKLLTENGEYIKSLLWEEFRLKSVGWEYITNAEYFAHFPLGWSWLKLCRRINPLYWRFVNWIVWTPLFYKIPAGEMFSWRYLKLLSVLKHSSLAEK